MAQVFYIGEIAVLLFLSYGAGWLVGYAIHRLLGRTPVAVVPAERLAAVVAPPTEHALVKPPVVEPVNMAPPPSAGPMPAATIIALDELAKIPMAATLPPLLVSDTIAPEPEATNEVATPAPPDVAEPPLPPSSVEVEPAKSAPPAMPSSVAGLAYAGALGGRSAKPLERMPPLAEVAETLPEPVARPMALTVAVKLIAQEPEVQEPVVTEPEPVPAAMEATAAIEKEPAASSGPGPSVTIAAVSGDIVAEPVPPLESDLLEPAVAEPAPPVPAEPQAPAIAEPAKAVSPQPAPDLVIETPTAAPVPTSPPRVFDEDAAMRAIEGGWSRRASPALPDAPELIDVSAAVAKAQSAVQQVLVQSGIDPEEISGRGKPPGTSRPRDSSSDDLKQIVGLSPLDEQTLNNLGIYRFEQIAGWDHTEILWLENHAFARGRIVREDWQTHARRLLAARKSA